MEARFLDGSSKKLAKKREELNQAKDNKKRIRQLEKTAS